MQIYKTRQGVILTEIAGEYVLVAAKSLLSECPYTTQINESSAFLWRCMESGCDMKSLIEQTAAEYEISDMKEATKAIEAFVQQMLDLNYLIATKTEDADAE